MHLNKWRTEAALDNGSFCRALSADRRPQFALPHKCCQDPFLFCAPRSMKVTNPCKLR